MVANPTPPGSGTPVEARTLAEAYAFVELSLPPGDEWIDFDRFTSLHRFGDTYLLRFDGPYEDQHHTVEVSVPVPSAEAREESRLRYGDGRSTLIDAGQWCLLELANAGMAHTGLAQLDGAPPDDGTYRAIFGAWDAARAAADEVAKFLSPPVDGGPAEDDEVPATAFWTDLGRLLRAEQPELFRRSRLDTVRAEYRRQLDDVVARFDRPDSLADQEAPPTGAEAAEATADGEPIRVRTLAEAHLYLDLHPCVCGCASFPRGQMEILQDDEAGILVRYAGSCDDCARQRAVTMRLPQRSGVVPDSPYRFSYPEDGPSEVIDAGQWLDVADDYRTVLDLLGVPADPDEEPARREEQPAREEPSRPDGAQASSGGEPARLTGVEDGEPAGTDDGKVADHTRADREPAGTDDEAVVRLLVGAASAIEEALKFIPPGADRVPADAVRTASGHRRYQLDPDRFDRERLTAERDRCWRRVESFLARYGR
ncbi:hypothetical protein GCM10022225_64030 [Plantactinospora mayteni]|uniref:Uncharacterized protein n=1 Tax=Plantactinospora mayteni TaxID=566021 RepID=A0ABQ4F0D3_9ACTN|nr:hypothetical protein [Plantactinospora mayteni]GIH00332.1 hypothetical protein Pma05_69040 [Plantactinospora mayteni]